MQKDNIQTVLGKIAGELARATAHLREGKIINAYDALMRIDNYIAVQQQKPSNRKNSQSKR